MAGGDEKEGSITITQNDVSIHIQGIYRQEEPTVEGSVRTCPPLWTMDLTVLFINPYLQKNNILLLFISFRGFFFFFLYVPQISFTTLLAFYRSKLKYWNPRVYGWRGKTRGMRKTR